MTARISHIFTAMFAGALLLSITPASALMITVELGDCDPSDASTIVCDLGGGGIPNHLISGGDPLWIDFTLGGAPMAHLVAEEPTSWVFAFTFEEATALQPGLVLTDMDVTLTGTLPADNAAL